MISGKGKQKNVEYVQQKFRKFTNLNFQQGDPLIKNKSMKIYFPVIYLLIF